MNEETKNKEIKAINFFNELYVTNQETISICQMILIQALLNIELTEEEILNYIRIFMKTYEKALKLKQSEKMENKV